MKKKDFESVVDGLKAIYRKKIRPIEELYMFDKFNSSPLSDSDIESKPMTDRFVAVMHGIDERVIPGNAAAVQADKPFQRLTKFGTQFLSKFQTSVMPSSILEEITFIDTPGVLSGEKQRIGRSYDFVSVCEWFAERSDMILLLFDAHKLDISDEFKRVIHILKRHDEKIRVVLNKANMVSTQQLMRVYGALMWSLGKVIQTPEVVRVYISSFGDYPGQYDDHKSLVEVEHKDLLNDLLGLPRNSATRKINEIVKRARIARTHAIIISHLKSEMPAVFKKKSKQNSLIENLEQEFEKISQLYNIPMGDLPNIETFKEKLVNYDFSEFPKFNEKLLMNLDEALGVDLPHLIEKFPPKPRFEMVKSSNPFDDSAVEIKDMWSFNSIDHDQFNTLFYSLNPVNDVISGATAKTVLMESRLPLETLAKIWKLADLNADGSLDRTEFAIAMHLVQIKMTGHELPDTLPETLLPSKTMDEWWSLVVSKLDKLASKYPKTWDSDYSYGTAGFRMRSGGFSEIQLSKWKNNWSHDHCLAQPSPIKIVDPLGEMLESKWEEIAVEIVNSNNLTQTFLDVTNRLNIGHDTLSNVLIARDTRPSGEELANAAIEGASAIKCQVSNFGLLTTPQCHYLVRSLNTLPPYGDPSENGYFTKFSTAYEMSGKKPSSLVVDAANGVGGAKMKEMINCIGSSINATVINDGDGVLNHLCGSDHVKVTQSP
ncbi:hypothetical protein ROZALSC1DRAFT_30549, partial [Rozella allomycis CSF55]